MPTPQFFYLLSGMMLYQCKSCKISEFYGDDQQRPAGGAASFADWD